MIKALVLALLAPLFFSISSPVSAVEPSPYFIELALHERISCTMPDGNTYTGSGSRVAARLVLTADHVTHGAQSCSIDGRRATLVFQDPSKDYSILMAADVSERRVPITCEAPVEGARYFAIGWAHGTDFVVQPLTGTYGRFQSDVQSLWNNGMTLRGSVWPGNSGGAVVNELGLQIGIVVAKPRNGNSTATVRALADTVLCPADGNWTSRITALEAPRG